MTETREIRPEDVHDLRPDEIIEARAWDYAIDDYTPWVRGSVIWVWKDVLKVALPTGDRHYLTTNTAEWLRRVCP